MLCSQSLVESVNHARRDTQQNAIPRRSDDCVLMPRCVTDSSLPPGHVESFYGIQPMPDGIHGKMPFPGGRTNASSCHIA